MNPYEISGKYHFSYCVDRHVMRGRLEHLYRNLVLSDEGDVLNLNFGDIEIHCVIIDEVESEDNEND